MLLGDCVPADPGVAYLQEKVGQDAQLLDQALEDRQVLMAPVMLTEVLSDPKLPSDVAQTPPNCH